MADVRIYANVDALAYAVASNIAAAADQAIAVRGRFAIALAGGSTPRRAYETLASDEFRRKCDWDHWHIFWGDERCVPSDSQDNNAHMAQMAFLNVVGIPTNQIHRIRGEDEPATAAADYDKRLNDFFVGRTGVNRTAFDVTLLGLGKDGHTASLFPGTRALDATERWCVANYVPSLDQYRITLTLPAINESKLIMFIVSGADKAEIIRKILQDTRTDPPLPAQRIRPERGSLIWMLDETAATLLRPALDIDIDFATGDSFT